MISTTDLERAERMTETLKRAIQECDDLIVYARRQVWEGDHAWRDRVTGLRTARNRLTDTLAAINELFH